MSGVFENVVLHPFSNGFSFQNVLEGLEFLHSFDFSYSKSLVDNMGLFLWTFL